jgi:hypothetical protein
MIENGETEALVHHQASINYNYTINLVKMNLYKMSQNNTKTVDFDEITD